MKRIREQEHYNFYSASFRIINASKFHQDIEKALGVKATHEHKKGSQKTWKGKIIKNRFWPNDIWILKTPLSETKDLNKHLSWLCKKIYPHKDFLSKIQSKRVKMDIYGSYRTGSPTGGIEIEPKFFKILSELNIPFGVSVQFEEPLFRIFKKIS